MLWDATNDVYQGLIWDTLQLVQLHKTNLIWSVASETGGYLHRAQSRRLTTANICGWFFKSGTRKPMVILITRTMLSLGIQSRGGPKMMVFHGRPI